MEHDYAIIFVGAAVTCVIGRVSFLAMRSVQKIDDDFKELKDNIKELWKLLNDLSDEVANNKKDIAVLQRGK